MRRFVAIFLVLCLVFCMIPVVSAAPLPFTDVTMGDWFFEEVAYVYNGSLMSGTTGTSFSPNVTTTRGMIVTILHRMEGCPEAANKGFSDVAPDAYFAKAVAWASDNGIVGGYGNGRFGPGDPITREQLAAILYRFVAHQGRTTDAAGELNTFADGEKVSSYARIPMAWAVGAGLISGVGEDVLDPTGTASRAQVAAILTRFCQNIHAGQKPHEEEQKKKPVTSAEPEEEDILIVDGTAYYLGMDAAQLPTETERLPSVYGVTWYVFGTDDYDGFFAAGVGDGTVRALTAAGNGFSYMGYSCGDQGVDLPSQLARDCNDGDIVHGVLLLEDGLWEENVNPQTLAGESKLNYHMTNAFRVYHGLHALYWCDIAAQAARLHSVDMAENNYFHHDSLDGRKFYNRMKQQGLEFARSGENIAASTIGMAAFEAYAGWVTSAAHRVVMLGDYEAMGVGAGYCDSSTWACCYTQDFYR